MLLPTRRRSVTGLAQHVPAPIDDRRKYETRSVVVELDQLPAALGRKMKIPGAKKTNLRPSKLHNCWRIAQDRRLPGLTGSNAVKGENEIGYLGEDGARNDLMLRHHREFSRHLRHPGGLERSVEVLGKPRFELQLILSTCWQNRLALGASGLH
jgi:hypothetical protein